MVELYGKGAIPDSLDSKDYKYEQIMGVGVPFDWNAGWEIPHQLKMESQNGSLSCVGQSWAKYAEELEMVENKNFTDLSAKDIYQRIFAPQGGAEIRLGGKLVVNLGVNTEEDVPSYENGIPPSETYMRKFIGGDEEALIYKSKSYASVVPSSIDHIAQVIRDNLGCVSGFNGDNAGWATAFIKPPLKTEWGHAVYLIGAQLINGKKYIKFQNSWGRGWGEGGYGYFDESYLSNIFSLWTLIDQANPKTMLKLKIDSLKNQYLVDEETKIALTIANEEQLIEFTNHYKKFGTAELFSPVGYLIVHGATGRMLKEFFNL